MRHRATGRTPLDFLLVAAMGVLGVAALLLAPGSLLAPGAVGHTAGNPLHPKVIHADKFENYDFGSKSARRNNVDWAVDLIFGHAATTEKVRDAMDETFHFGPPIGSSALGDSYENGHWGWSESAGRKTLPCEVTEEDDPFYEGPGIHNIFHYRIYGPEGSNHFVNQQWGDFVYATAHIDHDECHGPDTFSGKSEYAEHWIANEAEYYFGRRHVWRDQVEMDNVEPKRPDGADIWNNDGFATFVYVSGSV